jgi:thymidylate kinase
MLSVATETPPIAVQVSREPSVQPETAPRLRLIGELIDRLGSDAIRYCQWKSNFVLAEALTGVGDLDLLVDRKDADRFHALLAALGFRQALDTTKVAIPSVCHFYGCDRDTGRLVHLHVYYRILTGESLLKNYHLPLEEMLLQHTRLLHGVVIPQRPAELIVFVIRAMLKHCSLVECLLLRRMSPGLRDEMEWLLEGDSSRQAEDLLSRWLPVLETKLFRACLEGLRGRSSALERYRLAKKLQRRLAGLRRTRWLGEVVTRARVLARAVGRRLSGQRGGKELATGGAVIAFIGPDATGKSTLAGEVTGWLGKVFRARCAHLGRPPSTWLTLLPNFLGRCLRPMLRPSIETGDGSVTITQRSGLLYAVRSVLLAWDRRALAVRLHKLAANGAIVVCDRYPCGILGAMDGPRLDVERLTGLRGRLARLENRLYREVPPPDILIRLRSAVEVAVQRNRDRQQPGKEAEPEAYIRGRHAGAVLPSPPNCQTVDVDTNGDRAETLHVVREAVWKLL